MSKQFLVVLAALLAVLVITGVVVAQDEEMPEMPAIEDASLEGATFIVGSKDFSEQIILAYITMAVLEEYGAETEDQSNIVGTVNTRTALESGDIDIYWEYTGTGWITLLQETTPIFDPVEQYTAVAERDLEENEIVWLTPALFNNTYAMAILAETAEELEVEALSDLADLDTADLTFCIESEFSTRDDGMPGMLSTYGIEIPEDNIFMLDTGVIYTETASGETCNFGEVFATDGRIAALDLVVMEDDENFFPIYNPAPTIRLETLTEYPQLFDILAPVSLALDNETMQALNGLVDVDGEDPQDVAIAWLLEMGFISE
ncbi:MAG: glycine betaine ABC transporter substrate-binding protein [Phototrophicaceae bacterium]